jgi:hypothetical protein
MLDLTEFLKRNAYRQLDHEATERASRHASQNRTTVSCISQRAHQLLVQRNSNGI